MKFPRTVWQEGFCLFVDDGTPAALCVGLILILTVAVLTAGLPGCIGILVWSVFRAIPR